MRGIDFAIVQLARAPYQAKRRTIDVSGDGTNNSGRDVWLARDEAVAKGITINGLVILSERPMPWNPEHTNPPGGLPNYYRNNVIGGPGAFVMVAENFASFGQAIIKKLIAEIAQLPPPARGIACGELTELWTRDAGAARSRGEPCVQSTPKRSVSKGSRLQHSGIILRY